MVKKTIAEWEAASARGVISGGERGQNLAWSAEGWTVLAEEKG
jgi:hypothetical protein